MAIIAARIAAVCWAAKREDAASGTPRAMLQPASATRSTTHTSWPATRGRNKNGRDAMVPRVDSNEPICCAAHDIVQADAIKQKSIIYNVSRRYWAGLFWEYCGSPFVTNKH